MEYTQLGKSGEDYLEAILLQIKENGACRATDVANRLGFSKPSASIAIKKLEDDGYIYRDDWRILLTESGMAVAKKLLDKHSFFVELFKKIGIEGNVAEEEACKIEHIISDESFHKIASYIRNIERQISESE